MFWTSIAHLSRQKSCQVDFRDHLAAAVTLLLVSVLMVLHQVPHFDPAVQVRSDHRSTGAQAVGASSVLDHVLCGEKHALVHVELFEQNCVRKYRIVRGQFHISGIQEEKKADENVD